MLWLEHPSPSIFSMRSVSRSSSFISFMRVSALSRTFLYASRASLRTSFPSPAAVSPNSLRASLYSSFFMTVYFKSCFWPVARLIKTLLQKRGQSVSQPSGDGCPVRSPILRNMQTIVFFAVNPYLADSINAYGNFMVSLLSPSVMTLAILIVSCVFFMSGKVRSDIVALCALLALLIFGILTPAEALSGFASPVVIMMVGLFVVGAGIFRTGLAKMISSRILRIGGKNENVLFVLVMLVTALIGAFVSNTGTVAVMLPIVMSMAASSGISSSRYLMPMAFASSMGLFTLISTPPNLVIQEALVDAGMEPLGFFSFAPVGAVVVAVGIGVLYFLSRLLVRKDEGKRNENGRRRRWPNSWRSITSCT